MSKTIRCDIVSAHEEIFSGEAAMIYATGMVGELGISPRHAPLITQLKPGPVRVAQPDGEEAFFVAETFTGAPGKYVSLKDTIRGFKGIVEGEYDHLSEQAFYMVGGIEEAVERDKELQEKAA
ncbi:MAG: hypothetical protein ACR2QU_03650 [Gammaproteobacteria bacterium]